MFLRFTKGKYGEGKVYRRGVVLNGTTLVYIGENLVSYAQRQENTKAKSEKWVVYIAIWNKNIGIDTLDRYIKDMISKSYKYAGLSTTRRRYHVEYIRSSRIDADVKISINLQNQ